MYGRPVGIVRTYGLILFGGILLVGTCYIAYEKIRSSQREVGSNSVDVALRERLTPMQYYVTQEDGTEPPYHNEYWDNHEEGIYVDVVSGEALFSSIDKYDSGTGWPSFTKPISDTVLTLQTDYTLGLPRTEVRGAKSDSHLGHLFDDGPPERGGKRFCMNSAALRFIAKSELESEGYSQYLSLFN